VATKVVADDRVSSADLDKTTARCVPGVGDVEALVELAALAAVIAAGTVMFWPRPDRITEDRLNRFPLGMSGLEAETMLGGPPGDFRTVWTKTAEEDRNFGNVDDMARNSTSIPPLLRMAPPGPGIKEIGHPNEGVIGIVSTTASTSVAPSGEHNPPSRTFFGASSASGTAGFQSFSVPQSPIENLLWRAKCQWSGQD
jgi:hypothetical protein